MPSLDALIVISPPFIVMQPLQPVSALTASGSERTASPPFAVIFKVPEFIIKSLSQESPFFADCTLRVRSSTVRVPYSPTLTAFFELQLSSRVPLPIRVILEFALPLITADSAYSAFVPSPPSSVEP